MEQDNRDDFIPEDEKLLHRNGANNLVAMVDSKGNIQNGSAAVEKKALMGPVWVEANNAKNKEASADMMEVEPVDRYNMVYFIMMLHGVGTLMPWNMFITANAYFVDFKLADSTSFNSTNGVESDAAIYRNYFLSFLGFTAQIPNVVLNAINLFCQCGGGGNITKRIVWSIIIVVIMFIVTVGLAMVDSSEWPGAFFWITMVTVVIINMANGVYQNSVYGTAACLPMKYTNAVVLGSNISGTLTSILSIISIASTPNPRTAAIYYFLAAIFILLVAFDTYFALPLLKFYRYFDEKAKQKSAGNDEVNTRPPFLKIFRQCWVQDLSVFFVFFVTLTCFPAIQANIQRADPNFIIPAKFYTPVTCFLFFNCFAMFGNLASEFVRKPGPRWVWLPVVLRGLFIPFFMFCNFKPDDRAMPVLINNDWVYVVGGILMAFTSGYYSSLTMMFAPRCVEPQYQPIAGMMAAFFLISGIFMGVIFSLPVTIFVQSVG